jgi:hypothetical protein
VHRHLVSYPSGFYAGRRSGAGLSCAMSGARAVVVLAVILAGALFAGAVAQDDGRVGAGIGDDIIEPDSTVAGVTPTPTSAATALPIKTAAPSGVATPAPTPARQDYYITPGYGNAQKQSTEEKEVEKQKACDTGGRPPTSAMLGNPGAVLGDPKGSWLPILAAVAIGAGLFAVIAYGSRKRDGRQARPRALESVATLVAICGGLAALAAQFIPSAAVEDRPPKVARLSVRDVKERITRDVYLHSIPLTRRQEDRVKARYKGPDLDELGTVIWLEVRLQGFKGQELRLQYGSYDVSSGGALLPDTARSVRLVEPERDIQTLFVPAWVGYPRSDEFKVDFRLLDDHGGLLQLATTKVMTSEVFRYACPSGHVG